MYYTFNQVTGYSSWEKVGAHEYVLSFLFLFRDVTPPSPVFFYITDTWEITLIDKNHFEASSSGRLLLLGRDPFNPAATFPFGVGSVLSRSPLRGHRIE